MHGGPDTAALTTREKTRLLFECLPLVFWMLAFIFVATMLDDIVGSRPPLLLAFVSLILLITGFQAANRFRDLASGVALIREDLLERVGSSRRGAGRQGRFKELGRLRVAKQAVGSAFFELRYRVYYSPASKIVWRLEPLESSEKSFSTR